MASDIKTPIGNAPLVPVVMLATGLYLAWFGIHYWRQDVTWPTTPVKNVLTGGSPPAQTKVTPHMAELTSDVSALQPDPNKQTGQQTSTGTDIQQGTPSAIANAALRYVGHCYTFGGHPGADGKGCWDCSSFVNWVIGHDMGMNIPGGAWKTVTSNGSQHGPATTSWLLFGQAINLAQVQAGDICVSANHMGIAVSPSEMVSALNPSLGTKRTSIHGNFPDAVIHYRRIAGKTGTTQAPGTTTAGGRG